MNPLALLNPARWMLYAGAVAAAIAGYIAWEHHIRADERGIVTALYENAISKQKAEAAQALADETAKVLTKERSLREITAKQELQDAEHQKAINGLSSRLRAAGGAAGRLRDPNAPGCGGGSGGATGPASPDAANRAADRAESGGLLSKQLTEFLLSQAASADQINLAYSSCREDATNARKFLGAP